MGHLINPLSMRLSINSFWNSNWSLINNFNYINLFKKDYILFHFLTWFIKKASFLKFNILLSHYKVYRVNEKLYINLYYYNGNGEDVNHNFPSLALTTLLNNNNNLRKKQKKYQKFVLDGKISHIYEYVFKSIVFHLYWILIVSAAKTYLKAISLNKDLFYLNVYSLDFLNITTDAITNYISLRLQKKFSLNWILRPILKDLTYKVKYKSFLGYKLVCSGRFTRKQIATYMWMRNGSVKLNTVSNLIKYSEVRVRLKYGLCGIKLWINYGNNNLKLLERNLFLLYPKYILFKYSVDLTKKSITFSLNSWFFYYIRIVFFKLEKFIFYQFLISFKIKLLIDMFVKIFHKKIYLLRYKILIEKNNKITIKFTNKLNYIKMLSKIK